MEGQLTRVGPQGMCVCVCGGGGTPIQEAYRAIETTSRKHVTKHFCMAKIMLCSMADEWKLLRYSRCI